MKKLILGVLSAACICLLLACGSNSSAATAFAAPTHTSTPLPTPVPSPSMRPTPAPSPSLRPSLELEGEGSLTAAGPCFLSSGLICPGVLTAKLNGPPFGLVDLTFNVFTNGTPVNPNCIGGCFPAGGNGQLNGGELTLAFSGTYCIPGACIGGRVAGAGQQTAAPVSFTYTLTGSFQIYTTQVCPTSGQ